MTPHERSVRAVETPGWLVKEIAPVVGDGRGLRVTVNVETVTLRGAILTELIEKEIAEAVAAERERAAKIVDNLARIFSTHYPDPKPEFNTAVAAFSLAHSLAETAADAIRDPVQ